MKVKINGADYVPILSGPAIVNLTLRSETPGSAQTYVGASLVADAALPYTLAKLLVPAGLGLSVKADEAMAECEVLEGN
jgi:hypothetical protein